MDKNTRISTEGKLATVAGGTIEGKVVAALDELEDVFVILDAETDLVILPTVAEVKTEIQGLIADAKDACSKTRSGQWEYAANAIKEAISHIVDLWATALREMRMAKDVFVRTRDELKSLQNVQIKNFNAGRRF